jgi:hypothetical protein
MAFEPAARHRHGMPIATVRRASLLSAVVACLSFIAGGCTLGGYAPQGSPAATDFGALGCEVAPPAGVAAKDGVDPLADGEPMFGAQIQAMTPRQVGDAARDRGLKVTWRYTYSTGPNTGFGECWCIPPEDGEVTSVAYGMANELIVFVDSGRQVNAPRQQPPRGWGC